MCVVSAAGGLRPLPKALHRLIRVVPRAASEPADRVSSGCSFSQRLTASDPRRRPPRTHRFASGHRAPERAGTTSPAAWDHGRAAATGSRLSWLCLSLRPRASCAPRLAAGPPCAENGASFEMSLTSSYSLALSAAFGVTLLSSVTFPTLRRGV